MDVKKKNPNGSSSDLSNSNGENTTKTKIPRREIKSIPISKVSESDEPLPVINIQTTTERKTARKQDRKSSDKKNPGRTKSNDSNEKNTRTKKLDKTPSDIQGNFTRTIFDHGLIAINPDQSPEILFLGIIDNLTSYTLAKQTANLFKRSLWEQEMLSTVPPSFYGDRFYKYLTTILLGDGTSEGRTS